MSNTVRLFVYLIVILLIIACYHDLNPDLNNEQTTYQKSTYHHYEYKQKNFQVVSIKVNDGDHFLFIMEKINPNPIMNIEQSIKDFQSLNPSTDIYQLKNERIYLFPIYH